MNLILDTCTFIWLVTGDGKVPPSCRAAILDTENRLFLSSVSTWEIMVKYQLGRLQLSEPPEAYVPRYREMHGIEPLPLQETDVLHLRTLPDYHRDPFDRMLICQAISNSAAIMTPDPLIRNYPVRVIW